MYNECISIMVLFDVTLWRLIESSTLFFRVEVTHLAQQGEKWLQILFNKIMSLWFPYKEKNFTINTVTVSPHPPPYPPFPRRTPTCGQQTYSGYPVLKLRMGNLH